MKESEEVFINVLREVATAVEVGAESVVWEWHGKRAVKFQADLDKTDGSALKVVAIVDPGKG